MALTLRLNVFACLCIWILHTAPVQCSLGDDDIQRIDEFILASMECHHIPGLALSVVSKDQVLLKKGYGKASDQGEQVTEETLFPIASTTKAFTTTLLALVLRNSKYTWDTPIKKIYPGFALHNELLTEHVTLRDILTHRTGIPGYFVALMAGYPKDMSLSAFIRNYKYHEPSHDFRTHFMYNNYMYALAGYIAELITGRNWQELIKEYIFTPLNMTSSTFVSELPNLNYSSIAHAFAHERTANVQIDMQSINQVCSAEAAGAILSTASDMAKWMQFHLNGGVTTSGDRLLNAGEMQEMYKSSMGGVGVFPPSVTRPDFPVEDVSIGYGLGWINSIYRGFWRVWHSGGILTYKSQVWLFPGLQKGIFLEVNGPQSGSWAIIHIAQYIIDILAKEEPWLNVTTVCSFPEPWKPVYRKQKKTLPNDEPPVTIEHYAGVYNHPAFGNIEIFVNDTSSTLYLKMGRFIEANLGYDKSSEAFKMQLIKMYWYLDDFIPIKITTPVCTSGEKPVMSILQMPLYTPYDQAELVTFRRKIETEINSSKSIRGRVPFEFIVYYVLVTLFTKNISL